MFYWRRQERYIAGDLASAGALNINREKLVLSSSCSVFVLTSPFLLITDESLLWPSTDDKLRFLSLMPALSIHQDIFTQLYKLNVDSQKRWRDATLFSRTNNHQSQSVRMRIVKFLASSLHQNLCRQLLIFEGWCLQITMYLDGEDLRAEWGSGLLVLMLLIWEGDVCWLILLRSHNYLYHDIIITISTFIALLVILNRTLFSLSRQTIIQEGSLPLSL